MGVDVVVGEVDSRDSAALGANIRPYWARSCNDGRWGTKRRHNVFDRGGKVGRQNLFYYVSFTVLMGSI